MGQESFDYSALFSFLPRDEYREAVRESESKSRELKFLKDRQLLKYSWVKEDAVVLLLVLGVFYRRVVAPSDGTVRFVARIRQQGASCLQVGRDRFSNESLSDLNLAVVAFHRLTASFGLSQDLLATENVEDFLYRLRKVLHVD